MKLLLSLSLALTATQVFGQTSCITLDELNMIEYTSCSVRNVKNEFGALLESKGDSCGGFRAEIKALMQTDTAAAGLEQLLAYCEATIFRYPCIDALDFENFSSCGARDFISKFHELSGDDCGHDAAMEARLLYREEETPEITIDNHTPENKDGPEFSTAMAWLETKCDASIVLQACIPNGVNAIDFSTIGDCGLATLRSVVNELSGDTCAHSAETEVRLLYRDSEMVEGTDGYMPNGPDLSVAAEWLVQKCYGTYGCTTSTRGHRISSCDSASVVETIADHMPAGCPHDLVKELEILTGSNNPESFIDQMCTDMWANIIPNTDFEDVDLGFDGTFMELYIDGGTFLNNETGNFQGIDDPAYPVSDASYSAGQSIDAFYTARDSLGARNSALRKNFDSFDQCQNQAVMCCWGRDRQSGDGNGNCNPGAGNCDEDANPADNTNLCYTEPSFTPYPRNLEGAAHCHGFAWGDDGNDAISQLKMNNFFYVAMHDHLYSRGYVERIDPNSDDPFPMCGCIEDMPKVSRSDCTQINAAARLILHRDTNHLLAVSTDAESDLDVLRINFNACVGAHPMGPDATGNLVRVTNDLASYSYRLSAVEGKMTPLQLENIFDVLVGYENPKVNNNEPACQQAYCSDPVASNLASSFMPTYNCRD